MEIPAVPRARRLEYPHVVNQVVCDWYRSLSFSTPHRMASWRHEAPGFPKARMAFLLVSWKWRPAGIAGIRVASEEILTPPFPYPSYFMPCSSCGSKNDHQTDRRSYDSSLSGSCLCRLGIAHLATDDDLRYVVRYRLVDHGTSAVQSIG